MSATITLFNQEYEGQKGIPSRKNKTPAESEGRRPRCHVCGRRSIGIIRATVMRGREERESFEL
jgi:hypothetical protein